MIEIVEFKGKEEALIDLMEQLQDYLAEIDPLHLRRREDGFGPSYTTRLFQKIQKNNGAIFVATDGGEYVGMVAGVMEEYTADDALEHVPCVIGRTLELIVNEAYRGQGIGGQLMERMEQYFVEKDCTLLFVKVFEPNVGAHGLYKKMGYRDRMIDMIKQIS